MKPRTDSLFARGLIVAAGFSLLAVALIGIVAFVVSRNFLTAAVGQASGQEATGLPPAVYADAITQPALRAAALVSGTGAIVSLLGIAVWASSTRGIFKRTMLMQRYLARVERGDRGELIPVSGHDELSALARSLNRVVNALREQSADSEARAAEGSATLEGRLRIYEAVRRIASVASALRDLQDLADAVVTLVAESLDIDRVSLFLVDAATQRASLSAVSSESSRDGLARHQVLRWNQELIARASATGETQLIRDVGTPAAVLGLPQLSQIHFELALPLKIHDRIVGVLDLQSQRADILTEDDVTALSMLADHLALSIDNARLMEESREVAEAYRRRYGEKTAQDWARNAGATMAFRFSGLGVTPLEVGTGELLPERAEIVQSADGLRELRAPIVVGDRVLGAVAFRQPIQAQPWGEEDISFVAAVCGQVGQALERARLQDEAQARVAWRLRQDALTERIWVSATDVDRVLETTIRELGTELSATGTIRLRALSDWCTDTDDPDAPLSDTGQVDA